MNLMFAYYFGFSFKKDW
jgi:hypothetical protein